MLLGGPSAAGTWMGVHGDPEQPQRACDLIGHLTRSARHIVPTEPQGRVSVQHVAVVPGHVPESPGSLVACLPVEFDEQRVIAHIHDRVPDPVLAYPRRQSMGDLDIGARALSRCPPRRDRAPPRAEPDCALADGSPGRRVSTVGSPAATADPPRPDDRSRQVRVGTCR